MKNELIDDALDPVLDFSESFINNLSQNEIIENVPILKSAVSAITVGSRIRDWLFAKKIWGFIKDDLFSPEEVNKVICEIDESKKYRMRAGEAILVRVDRAKDWEITEILAKLLKAKIQGKISTRWFMRMSDIISDSNMTNIRDALDIYNSDYRGRDTIQESPINSGKMNLGSGFYYLNNKPLVWDGDSAGVRIFMKREIQAVCKIINDEELDEENWRFLKNG